MKNIGIILLTGLGMLAIGMGLGQIVNYLVPSVAAEYVNPALFRPWSDPKMNLYWFVPFITAAIMLFLWQRFRHRIKGSTQSSKGLNFGLIFWLIGIPGMIMSFSSFQLSTAIVLSWSISNLIEAVFAGMIYARWRP